MLIILVHNDGTGTEEQANYDYEVRINNEVMERGRILDHHRKDGWQALIRDIADRHQPTTTDPNQEKIDSLIMQARHQAKAAGLKPSDIDHAVEKAREP
jgi:hypothetical protein